ncbi:MULTISPECIES: hypothetical protein [Nitrincola]|jgi:hypothetical protein|uniref:GOLD domain-containing protein n=1 Tax=Nitrincola iocasae TaxID=2614693 RepID=A0A5J6LDK7_9GAMM|nr:hypothetical protein [Nitrincola iocasae]QEW06543.1 hypothetical protein F5I99_08475 [Nitrincola iocasae]
MNKLALSLGLLLLSSQSAWAHYPYMDCVREGEGIRCDIGYSDGSFATGSDVVIYDYDEQELDRVTSDEHSSVYFDLPEGEFFIQFDAGHEDPAEFDYVELQ